MFEFIETIIPDLEKRSARGRALVPKEALFFQDHFPGELVLPMTFALELAAQVAGPLVEALYHKEHHTEKWAFLSMVDSVKIYSPVALPAAVEMEAKVTELEESYARTVVKSYDQGRVVLNGRLLFSLQPMNDKWKEAIIERKSRIEKWMKI